MGALVLGAVRGERHGCAAWNGGVCNEQRHGTASIDGEQLSSNLKWNQWSCNDDGLDSW